jgi:hypothetical protein
MGIKWVLYGTWQAISRNQAYHNHGGHRGYLTYYGLFVQVLDTG